MQTDQWCNLELGGPWAKMQAQPSKGPLFPIPLSPYLSSSLWLCSSPILPSIPSPFTVLGV